MRWQVLLCFCMLLSLGCGGTDTTSTDGPASSDPTPFQIKLSRGTLDRRRNQSSSETTRLRLCDMTAQTQIDFVHTDGSSGQRYIVEAMSAGLALFDYDDDGLIDIYLLNGAPLKGYEATVPPRNALYRNEGGWQFTDVTDQAGVGDLGFGLGVTIGDYDNDGAPDIYVNNYGANVLYRNNGDGTFADVTEAAGVGKGNLVGAGACFLDMEADGDLDLYVGNYLEFDYSKHTLQMVDGIPKYLSPMNYPPVPDSLYRNNGDGTFSDVSRESGVGLVAGTAMGMVAADFDRDGDTDVFVLNDVAENFFFENDGSGNFKEVAIINGTAYNGYGDENASMGVDCGDYDNDGWLDFIMTSYHGEMPVLYRNLGGGILEDVTHMTGAGEGAFLHVNWGTGLVDFDNDGDRDIFIANGHTEDNIELRYSDASYKTRNMVWMNDGNGIFTNVSDACGSGLHPVKASRGAAFDDLDGDGRPDVVVLNSREEPTVIKNESAEDHHWLQIRLRGVHANRDGVGAQVTVDSGDLTQVAEVHSGRSYQSHYGSRLHFGLGARPHVERIRVRWIGGGTEVMENVKADQMLTIIEADAAAAETAAK